MSTNNPNKESLVTKMERSLEILGLRPGMLVHRLVTHESKIPRYIVHAHKQQTGQLFSPTPFFNCATIPAGALMLYVGVWESDSKASWALRFLYGDKMIYLFVHPHSYLRSFKHNFCLRAEDKNRVTTWL